MLDPCFKRIATVILAALGTFLFLGKIVAAWQTQPARNRTQLPSPEEPATTLLSAGPRAGDVTVETGSGAIHLCSEGAGCVRVSSEEARLTFGDCQLTEPKTPPALPGAPIDSLEVGFCGAEDTQQRNLVLLADGTIWGWEYVWEGDARLLAALVSRCATLAVLLIGFAWVVACYGRVFPSSGRRQLPRNENGAPD